MSSRPNVATAAPPATFSAVTVHDASFHWPPSRFSLSRKARKTYVAVSHDLYLTSLPATDDAPTSFHAFRGKKCFNLNPGSITVTRVAGGDACTLLIKSDDPASSRRKHNSLTLVCASQKDMEALAKQVENAARPLPELKDLLEHRGALCDEQKRALRSLLEHLVNPEDAPTGGGVADAVVGVAERVRGAPEIYEAVGEWVGKFVEGIAGSRDAIGCVQTVFGGIPFAGPVVQLVGLAGDLAAIETKRADMNRKLRDLGPICKGMMGEVIAGIVLCTDAVEIREFDVNELFNLLNDCANVSREAEQFVMKSARTQLMGVREAGVHIESVNKMKEDVAQLRVLSYVQDMRGRVNETLLTTQETQGTVQDTQVAVQETQGTVQDTQVAVQETQRTVQETQVTGQQTLAVVQDIRRSLPSEVGASNSGSPRIGSFKPSWDTVPPAPIKCSMDFNLDSNTPESKLKRKLLNGENKSQGLIGVKGMSGMGKSTTLICCANDEKVKERFSGGIYWLDVGKGCDSAKVIDELAKAVEEAGGGDAESKRFTEAKSLSEAVMVAKKWFRGHRCLFLFENLWKTARSKTGFLANLRGILDLGAESRAVFSSRFRELADFASEQDYVSVEKRGGVAAERILCAHADFSETDLETLETLRAVALAGNACSEDKESFESFVNVRDRCDGLPLSLAVAGKTIAQLARIRSRDGPVDDESRLAFFRTLGTDAETLRSKTVTETRDGMGGYDGFEQTMRATWDAFEKTDISIIEGRNVREVREMHGGLCLFGHEVWVPIPVLQRLWTLTREEAESVAEFFDEIGVAEVYRDGSSIGGLRVHDLINKVCANGAGRDGSISVRDWHRRLLDGYRGCCEYWWECDDLDDGYMRENLGRHLVGGEKASELKKLLFDFRWLLRRVQKAASSEGIGDTEILCIERDYETLSMSMHDSLEPEDRSSRADESEEPWLACSLVSEAVRLSWRSILEEPVQTGFQLHGRLFVQSGVDGVQEFLQSLRDHNERPLLRSIRPSLTLAGGSLTQHITASEKVVALASIPNSRKFLAILCSEVHIADLDHGRFERKLSSGAEEVWCIAVNKDGEHAVGGCRSGNVYVWALQSECESSDSTVCISTGISAINAIAMMPKRKQFVVASEDNTVQIWDWDLGGTSVGPSLDGHSEVVTCVDVSPDGQGVVSGSEDKTLRIWRLDEKGEAMQKCQGELDVIVVQVDGRVDDVLWSNAEENIVFRVLGRGIGVCKASGEIVKIRETANTSTCMTQSGDGKHLIVGCYGRDVEFFNMSLDAVRSPLRAMSLESVSSVEETMNGEYLLTAAYQEIRVWKMDRLLAGLEEGTEWIGHAGRVVPSADGRLVATGITGFCGVWDTETGELVWPESIRSALRYTKGTGTYILAFSPNSSLLASVSSGDVEFWNAATGERAHNSLEKQEEHDVECIAFSPNSELLATVVSLFYGGDAVCVWNVKSGACIAGPLPIQGAIGPYPRVWFSEDGERVHAASELLLMRAAGLPNPTDVTSPTHRHTFGATSDGRRIDDLFMSRLESRMDDCVPRIWCVNTQQLEREERHESCVPPSLAAGYAVHGDLVVSRLGHEGEVRLYQGNEDYRRYAAPLLGRLEHPIDIYWYDRERKRLWAALRNGTLAIVEVVDN